MKRLWRGDDLLRDAARSGEPGRAGAAPAAASPSSLCDPGDPFLAPLLVGLGLRTLSMTPTSIPIVKRVIRRLVAKDCVAFAEEACRMTTTREVELALEARLPGEG